MSRLNIYSILYIFLFVLAISGINPYYIIYGFCGLLLIHVLDRLGKGIVLRELICFHTAIICLLMPVIGYLVYNNNNYLARLWRRTMPVSDDVYFNYTLPAILLFTIALTWPLKNKTATDSGEFIANILAEVKVILSKPYMKKVGLTIIGIGILMFFIARLMPTSFRFLSLLFFFSSFVGFLYVYYSPEFKYKKLVIGAFAVFIIANSVSSGMFTIIAYMGLTLFSFIFLGLKISFWKKLFTFLLGSFLLLSIQSIKPAYRNYIWKNAYQGNKAQLFFDLLSDKIMAMDLLSEDEFFLFHYRTNQGYNIALAMKRFPAIKDFDGGARLGTVFAASFVPRFLWPDKPEAGGKFNMLYYAGMRISGWSTNVGPVGEAYGSFGIYGGMVYMFILGLFVRWAYTRIFAIVTKIPLIICWIPVLFYQTTYSAESDTLQILNSLIKSAVFIWILYKIVPVGFGILKASFHNWHRNTSAIEN